MTADLHRPAELGPDYIEGGSSSVSLVFADDDGLMGNDHGR
jgi:hypothetical protein